MNRREFLLAIGATACSGRAAHVEEPEPDIPARPDAAPALVAEHPTFTNTNLDAPSVAIHEDMLVQREHDELHIWELATMRRAATFMLPNDAFTLLADGSIVAFGQRANEHDCAVYRIANGTVSTYPTWLCGKAPTLLLRTASTDSVYSVRDKEIVRFRFDGTKVEADVTIPIPVPSYSNREQTFSLDDGRIVAPGDGISILAPNTPPVHRPMPKVLPRHLARATSERFWYTRSSRKANAFDTLVLAHLDTPHRDARVVRFAPSRIVHVASHGTAIAVLLMSSEQTWHVGVVNEDGTERWRAAVPRQPRPYDLNNSAVALSSKRLVLATPAGTLLAWDAITGSA